MRTILLIICLLVTAALQIIYYFFTAAAAATFLFVVIDIHCSVVILWKIRKEEQQQLLLHTSSSSLSSSASMQNWCEVEASPFSPSSNGFSEGCACTGVGVGGNAIATAPVAQEDIETAEIKEDFKRYPSPSLIEEQEEQCRCVIEESRMSPTPLSCSDQAEQQISTESLNNCNNEDTQNDIQENSAEEVEVEAEVDFWSDIRPPSIPRTIAASADAILLNNCDGGNVSNEEGNEEEEEIDFWSDLNNTNNNKNSDFNNESQHVEEECCSTEIAIPPPATEEEEQEPPLEFLPVPPQQCHKKDDDSLTKEEEGSIFREMFRKNKNEILEKLAKEYGCFIPPPILYPALGACIVVLAVYLIQRRKFYLDVLLQPESNTSASTAPEENKSTESEDPEIAPSTEPVEASKTDEPEATENHILEVETAATPDEFQSEIAPISRPADEPEETESILEVNSSEVTEIQSDITPIGAPAEVPTTEETEEPESILETKTSEVILTDSDIAPISGVPAEISQTDEIDSKVKTLEPTETVLESESIPSIAPEDTSAKSEEIEIASELETSNTTTEASKSSPSEQTEETSRPSETSKPEPESEELKKDINGNCEASTSPLSVKEEPPDQIKIQTPSEPSSKRTEPISPAPATPPPPPEMPALSPPTATPVKTHNAKRHGGGKRRKSNSKTTPSVLERFSGVLNKAQQSKVTPPPQQQTPSLRKGSIGIQLNLEVMKQKSAVSITPSPTDEPTLITSQKEEAFTQKAIRNEEATTGSANDALPVDDSSRSAAETSITSISTTDEKEKKLTGDDVTSEVAAKAETQIAEEVKEKVEDESLPVVEGPTREPPVIELLDVLKGDTTTRAIRITSGVLISNRYIIEKEIGRGGFSKVYLGTDTKRDCKVAIKTASRLLNQTKSLKRELAIYEDLQRSSSNLAIPYLIHYTETDIKRMSVLVMDLLGPSLEILFETCDCKFSMGTVAVIMEQLLGILEYIHEKTYIHRDIKPENILVGRLGTPAARKIFLIDFGVVSNWCNTLNGKHVRLEYGVARLGTNSYMSMNASRGKTQSRKDDLEALGYCMYRFLKVNFPWHRYDDMNDGIKAVITFKMKSEMDFIEEFPVSSYPKEVPEYLQYVKELGFETKPDYEMLREKFRDLGKRLKDEGEWDGVEEWTKQEIVNRLPDWIIPN